MRTESGLAQSFFKGFMAAFQEQCESDRGALLPLWKSKSLWTEFMLDNQRGFLTRFAKDWTEDALKRACIARNEWHKFDLMILASSETDDWWRSIPLVTVEHENDNGIQDEVWKLACWKSKLKVLITYHDDNAQENAKRETAARIIASIADNYGEDPGTWLLMSAPRTWNSPLAWIAHTWAGSQWSEIRT